MEHQNIVNAAWGHLDLEKTPEKFLKIASKYERLSILCLENEDVVIEVCCA